MSRDFTPSEREDSREPSSAPRAHTPPIERSEPAREPSSARNAYPDRAANAARALELPPPGFRAVLHDRDRAYRLRGSEIHTLTALGKFRVVAAGDLAKHVYHEDRHQAQQDIHNLTRQGLICQGTPFHRVAHSG